MNYEQRYMKIYLGAWLLVYGLIWACSATIVQIRAGDDATIDVDAIGKSDSLNLDAGWDWDAKANVNEKDTVLVKRIDSL